MRSLTDSERDRLGPLIDETEIPIRVADEIEAIEDVLWLSGEATGWRPGRRRVELSERSIEHLNDDALLGLVAHEIGHHRGYHVILAKLIKAVVIIAALTAFLGGFAAFFATSTLAYLSVPVVGITAAVLFSLFGSPALSRWMEYDADRRAAMLLGSTEPLEALCDPISPRPSGLRDRLADLCYPWPHPADRLASLEQLD